MMPLRTENHNNGQLDGWKDLSGGSLSKLILVNFFWTIFPVSRAGAHPHILWPYKTLLNLRFRILKFFAGNRP